LIALTNQEDLSRTGGYRDSRFDFIILFFFICSDDKLNSSKPLFMGVKFWKALVSLPGSKGSIGRRLMRLSEKSKSA
jgi:hypothetical protein